MGRTACTEPQCLYKGALYLFFYLGENGYIFLTKGRQLSVDVCGYAPIDTLIAIKNVSGNLFRNVTTKFEHILKSMKDSDIFFYWLQLGCHPVAVHIYTQTIYRTTQKNNRTTQIQTNVEECGPCPVFVIFPLAFALQLRKKHGKTSVRVKKNLTQVKKTLSQSTVYILPKHPHFTKPNKHTHYKTHTRTHTHTHTHTLYI